VCGGDERQVLLPLALAADFFRRSRGCTGKRSGARTLDAGVGVAFVVVADVNHVLVALHGAGQGAEADVKGGTVAADADHGALLAKVLERAGHARGDCGDVFEKRVDVGDRPRGLGIRSRDDFHAARGVDHDDVRAKGFKHVAHGECGAAARTRAVALHESRRRRLVHEFFVSVFGHLRITTTAKTAPLRP